MPSFVKVNKHRRGNESESESESEIPSQIPASAVMMAAIESNGLALRD